MGKVRDGSGVVKECEDDSGRSCCALCNHKELYSRKDFPRGLGLGIVFVAALLTFLTESYWPLAAAALIDALLYLCIKDVVVCYQCGAEHRKCKFSPKPEIFDIAIADRHRFGPAYKGPRSTND